MMGFNAESFKHRLLRYEYLKDCMVRHRRPSASYNTTVLYTPINENFDHYTYCTNTLVRPIRY